MAQDSQGREVIILGKGVGFPKTPYTLADESKIEHTFYNVSSSTAQALKSIRPEYLALCSNFGDIASQSLGVKLNPNMPLFLADHLQFAVERTQNGYTLTNPFLTDIQHVYPLEYALGQNLLRKVHDMTGIQLIDDEAANIALYLVNAEGAPGAENMSMHEVMESTEIINKVTEIVERTFDIKIDATTYAYGRFAAHLRFLVVRLSHGKLSETTNRSLFRQAALDFPDVYQCAVKVDNYLRSKKGWKCNDEELLYLMMHINRLRSEVQR